MSDSEKWITTHDALAIIRSSRRGKVSMQTLYNWLNSHPMLGKKIVGRWKVNKEHLEYMMKYGTKHHD